MLLVITMGITAPELDVITSTYLSGASHICYLDIDFNPLRIYATKMIYRSTQK